MAERESIGLWSTTAATNSSADPSVGWAEGQLPSTVNNSARAMMAAHARFKKDIDGSLTTAGSANAYTLTINNTWTAYANGQIISFKASFANTSAATINVTNADAAALGAKAIRAPGDIALVANQIISGGRYILQYDTAANSSAGAWIVLNPSSSTGLLLPCGRVTLTTGVAVTESDVTGATTIYYNPSLHNGVQIFDGSFWRVCLISELSLALDSNSGHTGYQQSGKNFHVVLFLNSNVATLGTGVAWSTDTTTGTGAGTCETEIYEGRLVNKNAMTVRFGTASGDTVSVSARQALIVGGIRMTANGQTEDSFLKRFVSNVYNVTPREMKRVEPTVTWNYSTATFQQANASTANQLAYFHCVGGRSIYAKVMGTVANSTATFRIAPVGIGIDSSTVDSSSIWNGTQCDNGRTFPNVAEYRGYPGIGYHEVRWLEKGAGTDTQTWVGAAAVIQSGILGSTLN